MSELWSHSNELIESFKCVPVLSFWATFQVIIRVFIQWKHFTRRMHWGINFATISAFLGISLPPLSVQGTPVAVVIVAGEDEEGGTSAIKVAHPESS